MLYGYETPEDHPHMNPRELAFIRKGGCLIHTYANRLRFILSVGQNYSTVAAFDKEQDDMEELRERSISTSGRTDSTGENDSVARVAMVDIHPECASETIADVVLGTRFSPRHRLDNSFFFSGEDHIEDEDQLTDPLLTHRQHERQRVESVACSIISDTEANLKDVARRIPWGHFIRDPVSLTLLFAFYTMSFIGFMVLAEIPSFLTQELDFDIDEAGFVSVAPYFAQLISSVGFGQVFGYLQSNHGWETRQVRQVAQFISFGGSACCLVLCGFMKNVAAAVFFLVFALFLYGATQSGLACSFLDVSPNYSCSLNSLANLVGAIAGIMAPLIVSMFTLLWPGPKGWQAVFIFTATMCVSSLYFWKKYQPCEVVPNLNSPRPKKTVNYKEWFPWFRI